MDTTVYLDASALTELAVFEEESIALQAQIAGRPALVASRLAAAEFRRACARSGHPKLTASVDDVLDGVTVVDVSAAILETAGRLEPPQLRTFDAIHVATALSLGVDALHFITYDDRLARAARSYGLIVMQPGIRRKK